MTTRQDDRSGGPRDRVRALAGADAGWDTVLGIALVVVAFPGPAAALGLPTAGTWPVWVVVALGCFAFAVLLARASRAGTRAARAICGPAAVANLVAAVVVLVLTLLLIETATAAGLIVLVVAVVGCLVFGGLEAVAAWRGRRRAPDTAADAR